MMFKQATSTAARLRARTISAPISRPLPLPIESSKAQAAPSEPTLTLSDHKSQDRHEVHPQMLTFGAFDPCASRPLLMSGLSLNPQDWQDSHSHDTYPEATKPTVQPARVATPPKPFKPWPYSLPKFLQPQPGTTYQLMYDSAAKEKPGRIGVLQALFYGVPNPEGAKEQQQDKDDGFVKKVMYGVKDDAE